MEAGAPSPSAEWRESIARWTFRAFAIVGAVAVLPSLAFLSDRGQLWPTGAIYAGIYAVGCVVAGSWRVPYLVRAVTLVLAIMAAGTAAFLIHGFFSDARLALLAGSTFAAVLLGPRVGTAATAFGVVLIALGGIGVVPVPTSAPQDLSRPAVVATLLGTFVFFTLLVMTPIGFVLGRFQRALETQRAAWLRARAATERAEAATRALAEERGLLQAIVRHSSAAIFVKNARGTYVLANDACESALGLPADRLVGRTDGELLPADAANEARAADARVLSGETTLTTRALGNPPRRFVTHEFPIRGPSGEVEAIGGIATDLSPLESRTAALAASEARHRAIFEAIGHGLVVLSPEGAVVEANRGAAQLFGYTHDELLRLAPGALLRSGEGEAPSRWLTGTASPGAPVVHARLSRRDGTTFDGEIRTESLPGGARTLVIVGDISAEAALDRRRRQLNVELETRVQARTRQLGAANQELEAFSYSVSHDLRAPLRHVTGYVQLLRDRLGKSVAPETNLHLDAVSGAAARMAQLIDDLLRVAREQRE